MGNLIGDVVSICLRVQVENAISLHPLVPLEEELLISAAPEDLHPLVRHLGDGGQLHAFQKCLVVRNRDEGALVRRQEPPKPSLETGQKRQKGQG